MSKLTERELWLINQAYTQGYEQAHNDTVDGGYTDAEECCSDWLSDMAGDSVTVEMVLNKEAPKRTLPTEVEELIEAARKFLPVWQKWVDANGTLERQSGSYLWNTKAIYDLADATREALDALDNKEKDDE